VTLVLLQEWHSEDSILIELSDDKRLLDILAADAPGQLYDTTERDARPVC